jgi:phosphate butyryltransferase
MIRTLDQMVEKVLSRGRKHRIAIAWAQDVNTLAAVKKAVDMGIVEANLLGNPVEIIKTCNQAGADHKCFTISGSPDREASCAEAVRLVRDGEADIVMKGLVGTDMFLKAVLDREKGLMDRESVLSYVCAIQIPAYHKLLFVTDPAVIPFPTLDQKVAMARYSVEMASRFGIDNPRIALISATEKKSDHFESSAHYAEMCQMALDGGFGRCIMDGPLDLFLACDKESVSIKGVKTPVDGEADILLFPSIESCNPFYKSLMLFAGGELAGLLRGTGKPVVMMSRSESEKSKFYCIALSCLMV